MLNEIIEKKTIEARAIVAFYPCNSNEDDDIEIYDENDGKTLKGKWCTLRQQLDKDQDNFVAMSDFIAPKKNGVTDYVGFFACSAGFNQDEVCKKYVEEGDDYNNMMVKTLTDRLAEALAEKLHEDVRKDMWGYAPDEDLSVADMLNVKYQGIRPAPGYPSQPDHTEKSTMWKMMNVFEDSGIELTESLAMNPASSVCGLYFAHPHSHYFAVDEICKDQVESYSTRKEMPKKDIEKWLSPILSYEAEE